MFKIVDKFCTRIHHLNIDKERGAVTEEAGKMVFRVFALWLLKTLAKELEVAIILE
jgi:hypothetical protein